MSTTRPSKMKTLMFATALVCAVEAIPTPTVEVYFLYYFLLLLPFYFFLNSFFKLLMCCEPLIP